MTEQATLAYMALGANLGDRIGALRAAVDGLGAHPEIEVMRASPVYETEPHTLTADEGQPSYLNAVAEVSTTLSPEVLLAYGHDLERAAGRQRRQRWMPRTLDIDLLVYGQHRHEAPGLVLPHPHLGQRRFVLHPWADLAPNLYVPLPFDASVAELLHRCPDTDIPTRTAHQLLEPSKPT